MHQKHNEEFPDDWIDTVEDMLERISEFHIDRTSTSVLSACGVLL